MSVTPKSIGDVTKVKAFDPSVRKICPVDPSDPGNVNPLMVTAPDPFPDNSKLSFDCDAVMLLSVIVTPVVDKVPLAAGSKVKVVNVPAAGVAAPITVLSMFPPSMLTLLKFTLPVPEPCNSMSALDVVTCITLSVKLIVESIVRLLMFTIPVPPGVRFMSAFELELIILSLKVKLSKVIV